MKIGLIGLPNSGKTTIFNALTKSEAQVTAYSDSKTAPNLGIVDVADDRVTCLSEMYKPRKTKYATVELIDVVGKNKGSARDGFFPSSSMGLIKNTDALALVVRNFPDDLEGLPTPLRDIEKINDELLISDLIITENRLERIEQAYRRGKRTRMLEMEEKTLHRILDQLNNNQPIRDLELSRESEKAIRGFQFLTQKPIMIILNSHETNFGKNDVLLAEMETNFKVIEFAGKFEMELSRLNDQEELQFFMEDMGIQESARDRLTRAAYELVGYISFFTVGSDEVRAWSIHKGETVLTAAGTIHSDLARGFIRTECFSYDDLMACGSEKRISEMGRHRLEGKDYIVQDGNILNIRFNV